MADRQMAVRHNGPSIGSVPQNETDELTLIRTTYAKDLTDHEFGLFVADARHRGLDIVNKEIVAWKGQGGRMVTYVTLQGARKLAEQSQKVAGTEGPFFCGPDGVWLEVWLADKPPAAAKFVVWRHDQTRPIVGIATWREMAKQNSDTWRAMPSKMLGKCSELDAYRRARIFPDDEPVYLGDDAPQFSPKTAAMRHLHGVGRERGLDHGDLRTVVTAIRPGTASMTDPEVGARDLGAAADLIDALDDDAVEAIVAEPERLAEPAALVTAPEDDEQPSYGGDDEEPAVDPRIVRQWLEHIDRAKTVRAFAVIEKRILASELDRVPDLASALAIKRGELGLPEDADAEMAATVREVNRVMAP